MGGGGSVYTFYTLLLCLYLDTGTFAPIFFSVVHTAMPFIAANDVANASSLCDELRDVINNKRVSDLGCHSIVEALEQALDRLNQCQGLGFVVYKRVVDKDMLNRILIFMFTILSTVMPIIFALDKTATVVDLASQPGACEMTIEQQAAAQSMFAAMFNVSCTYNTTIGPAGVVAW